MNRATCPDSGNLQALLDEGASGCEPAELVEHLETCADCQRTLEILAADRGVWDTISRGLIRSSREEPALRNVVASLKREEFLPHEEETYPYLRPADKPGLLGMLGPYEIHEVIGSGGMAVVFKAVDPALHRLVAIKVITSSAAGNVIARQRFAREARAAAAVCHDHIVAVHGVHDADGLPYLVMQFIAGESLQARLDRGGPLEVVEIVRIGLQTASGLAAAHAQGLIHRDIKPANLLLQKSEVRSQKSEVRSSADDLRPPTSDLRPLTSDLCVKITDFGLARTTDDVQLTHEGVVAGTPEYMAPEQARGEPVDHRADLFSLGSVLYALCTGFPPFRGTSALAVLRQVTEAIPVPVRERNPEVPAWLDALIGRLLAKDRTERFQSAAEVASLLEGYLAHLREPELVREPELPAMPVEPSPAASEPRLPTRTIGRRASRRIRASLVALMALLVGMAFWLAGAGNPAPKADKESKYFHQDFRDHKLDGRFWSYEPHDAEQFIKEEPEGLRITIPGDGENHWKIVGIRTKFRVRGDCEITISYELLRADKPPAGDKFYSVGVSLYALTDSPESEAALLGRFHRAAGQAYVCQRIFTDSQGKKQYPSKSFRTQARSGKLRLVRRGDVFTYMVADSDAAPFRELHQFKLTADDLAFIRVAAETQDAVDVRIRDFEVRGLIGPTDGSALPDAESPQKRGRKGWLAGGLFTGLTVTLSLALAAWFFLRRRAVTQVVGASSAKPAIAKTVSRRARFRPLIAPSRRVWLSMLVLTALLGLVTGYLLLAGNGKTKQSQEASDPISGRRHAVFDFRKGLEEYSSLALHVPDAATVVKSDAQGLQITLPGGQGDTRPVKLELKQGLRGDFDVVLGYELLAVGAPLPQYGAGVLVRASFDGPSSPFVIISRFRKRQGERLSAHKIIKKPDGTDQYVENRDVKAAGSKGKLRLVRKGTTLQYLVAEEGKEFNPILSVEIGAGDVQTLEVECSTMYKAIALDVRLVELVIDAEQFLNREQTAQVRAGTEENSAAPLVVPRQKGLLAVVVFSVLTLLAAATAGLWFFTRQGRGTAENDGPQSPDAEQSPAGVPEDRIHFPCSSCGQKLRISTQLTGKKVKCPQCKTAIEVPAV